MSRPLQPKAPPAGQAHDGGTDRAPNVGPSSHTRLIPLKKSSTACNNCRKRRIKCSGQQPCPSCVKLGEECVIDASTDRRRDKRSSIEANEQNFPALKRKILDDANDLEQYKRLVSRLRRCQSPEAEQVLSLIRSSASIDEVFEFVESRPSPDKSRSSSSEARGEVQKVLEDYREDLIKRDPPTSARSRPLRSLFVSSLVDEPIFSVPTWPWTTTTNDSQLVSHLISLWFTWQAMLIPSVDEGLFVRDMKSQKSDSRFCSPFLVAAMCADACPYSDYPETNAVATDKSTSGHHFFAEATRELERELERPASLCKLQGLTILAIVAFIIGKDTLGFQYWYQAAHVAKEWTDVVEEVARTLPADEAADLLRVTDLACFGIFSLSTMSAFTLRRPMVMQDALQRRTTNTNPERETSTWLSQIINHLGCLKYISPGDDVQPDHGDHQTKDILLALEQWFASLPECLTVEEGCSPYALNLNIYYHTILIHVAAQGWADRSHAPNNIDEMNASVADSEGSAEVAEASHETQAREAKSKAQAPALKHAKEVAREARMYQAAWDFYRPPMTLAQHISVALFALLDGLDDGECREAFTDLCIYARACARRWMLYKGVLRLVQLSARATGKALPERVVALFDDFDANDWREEDPSQFTREFPDLAISFARSENGRADIDTDQVLQRFWGLDLG